MKIGEVAQKSGIPASTIRYYEREGLVPPPPRVGGKRVFDPSVLDLLTIVDLAKGAGFRVAEIQRLLRGFSARTAPSKRWRMLAEKKLDEIEERMVQLHGMKRVLRAMTACTCPTFDDCAAAIKKRRKG